MNINALKNLALDRILEIDEAVVMSADARAYARECEELELPVPSWLTKSTDILREEIARRTRASDLAELKRLESELDGYKTVGEKKSETQRRLAALQSKLGLSKAASR